MGEQVLGLEAVLPNGRVITTRPLPKYSSGPDLTGCSSAVKASSALYPGSDSGPSPARGPGLRPRRRSTASTRIRRRRRVAGLGIRPTLLDLTEEDSGIRLFLLFEGYREGVAAQQARSARVCAQFGGRDIGPGPTEAYWKDRHQSGISYKQSFLGLPARPGGTAVGAADSITCTWRCGFPGSWNTGGAATS